jgi:hypothetical protein
MITVLPGLYEHMNYRTFFSLKKIHSLPVVFSILVFLSSCATVHYPLTPDKLKSYAIPDAADNQLITRYAPIFIIEEPQKSFNRIGTPSARSNKKNKEKIYIDPDIPTIYFMEQPFTTPKGSFSNLIYRVHFEKIPYSLFPFHLTAGKNIGIIVIVTINNLNKPVLLTIVNTCGCYLSITPTSFTPEDAYPAGWNPDTWQRIYGEYIPALLDYAAETNQHDLHPTVLIRSNTHRAKGLWLDTIGSVSQFYEMIPGKLVPMDSLEKLQTNGSYTPFFEKNGSRRGYVRGSHKPFERLLMSWWVFDWRIGEDKRLGPEAEGNSVFYTSVKFWDREKSNMWNFATFLQYWGWNF